MGRLKCLIDGEDTWWIDIRNANDTELLYKTQMKMGHSVQLLSAYIVRGCERWRKLCVIQTLTTRVLGNPKRYCLSQYSADHHFLDSLFAQNPEVGDRYGPV